MSTIALAAPNTDVAGTAVTPELWAKPITLELWARLKKSSRFYQGCLDAAGQPRFFQVESLFADRFEAADKNGANIRFNDNAYPLSHVELYVCAHGKMHRLK